MRTFHRILAGVGVVIATTLPVSAAMAAPAQVDRFGAIGGYYTTCTDELVEIDGTYHQVIKTKADGSVTGHVSIKAKGVGDKGNIYVLNENAWDKVNADGSEAVQSKFRMISKGSAQNLLQFVGFTISPSGEFTLTTDRSDCVG
jgi:hypothetical protein